MFAVDRNVDLIFHAGKSKFAAVPFGRRMKPQVHGISPDVRYWRLVLRLDFNAEISVFFLRCISRPSFNLPVMSSASASAEVSGGSVESPSRVLNQTALPRESCSTRPAGPPGRRGNFGRRILAVSTMESVSRFRIGKLEGIQS